MEGFSKDGRKLRPRKSATAGRTEKVDLQSEGSRPYENRRPYGEHRSSYGEHHSYGGHRNYGEHRAYGENRPYGDNRNSRPYGEQRPHGDRPYGERPYGDRPSRPRYSNNEERPYRSDSHTRLENAWGEHQGKQHAPGKPRKGGKNFKGGKSPFSKSSNEGINRMISRRPQVDRDYDGPAYEPVAKDEMRLNRFIANSGVCSRREADTFIQAGVVTVNGEVVTELGTKVNIFNDDVRFNGERLKGETKVYLVMNKPKGYVTSASDPHADKTVMDLLGGCPTRVYPVGRLDKATTGVLMFTNDGEIAERLTHPSYDKKKIYQVALERNLTQEDYDSILSGVTLQDGPVRADALEFVDENDHSKLGIEIHSGKNRIVRRIFESLGYTVKALDRVYFAGLTKKGLKKGEWRYLNEKEVNMLKMGAYV
ncbi:MAG: pseudouridine synthase [Bacteroidales bacterium]|nr:pseudouridine synthase [Bacteroidales bacterium]